MCAPTPAATRSMQHLRSQSQLHLSQTRSGILFARASGPRTAFRGMRSAVSTFALALNPAVQYEQKCTMNLSLDPSDELEEDKREYMAKKLKLTVPVQVKLSSNAPRSDTVMGFLRLRELKDMDAFMLKPMFNDDLWDIAKEPGSAENERAVCEDMAKEARAAISRYPTTVDDDVALLQSGVLQTGSREEAEVKARLGELQGLEATAKWFELRAANLSKLSYYKERWHKRTKEESENDIRVGPTSEARLITPSTTAVVTLLFVVFAISRGATMLSVLGMGFLMNLVNLMSASSRLTRTQTRKLRLNLNLLELRRSMGQPEGYIKDQAELMASRVETFTKQQESARADARFAIRTAVLLSCAVLGFCFMVGQAALQQWEVAVLATFYFIWNHALYTHGKAKAGEDLVEEAQLELNLATAAQDPSNPLSGPVKVGFLDPSLSLPVHRYLFRCCQQMQRSANAHHT